MDGGTEELVVDSLASSWGNWALTREGIYYVDTRDGAEPGWVIQFLAFGSETPVTVAHLSQSPVPQGWGLNVSTDGRWLLATVLRGGRPDVGRGLRLTI